MRNKFVYTCLLLLYTCIVNIDAKILDTIHIEGAYTSHRDVIQNSILLRRGREFTPSDVQESVRRLHELGLFRQIDFMIDEETDTSVSLTLSLIEFPIVERIEFEGNRKIKTKIFEEAHVVPLHRALSDLQLHTGIQTIRDMYADKGYLLAEIDGKAVNSVIPGNVIVKYTINEGPRVRIRSITFEGNESVGSNWLMRRFKTKENRWYRSGEFNRELYHAHLDTLMMRYQDLGYLDASVVRDTVWFSEDKRDINIAITVDEGRRYFTGDIAFVGNRIIESDTLMTKIALISGRPFRKNQFEMTRFFIETAYREQGYLWVRVEDKRIYRGENADTIDVVFEINESRPAIVRKVDIRNNTKTWENVIRREIALVPGQRYRQSHLASSQQNIMRLGYFTHVMPDIQPNDDGTIDLVFDITERDNIGQLSIGAAYSDQDKLTGTFSTAIPNFRGAGQELKFDVQYGRYRHLGLISFTEPWAFGTPLWLTGTLFYDRQIYSYSNTTDTSTSHGFRIGVGRSRLSWPDNKFRAHMVYQLSRDRTNRHALDIDEKFHIVETGILSKLRFNIDRYDLDMPLFPNEGSKLTIMPEIAGLGGNYRFLKGIISYENYFRLPMKLVFGNEVKLGAITKLFGDIIISGDDLFTGGGAYGDAIIRGYPDWAFGGYRNRNMGDGIAMFALNMSLRYPIVDQQIYIGAFADVGNTWPSISQIDMSDLYRGVGAGLRMNLPMIGIMGVDVAYGLDPINKANFGAGPNGMQWHIIMNRGF